MTTHSRSSAVSWDRPADRIGPTQRDRAAIVYVRQSTRRQVIDHSESTRLQYALVERAVVLGWARSRVVVIDDDLGVSAAMAEAREGFARLVTEVTMGRAGLVLGIEMSRLARTGRDWHQLLELCCLSGCLLADLDGVYDPAYYNDRLLLGLKGTISEAELYLIRQRMAGGKLAKAQRGELALPLPIGYWRRPSGEVVLEPDEQARDTVRLVFDAFDRLGTLNAVLRMLVEHDVRMPVRSRGGVNKGELEWHRPNRETLQIMLHSPVYAGYYAYGRRPTDPRRKKPGRPATGRVVRSMDEWQVLIPDRLPAFISPERYSANLARLEANRQTAATPGAPRGGAALLAGVLRCGICGGHRMTVQYHHGATAATHSYQCAFYQANYGIGGACQHIAGPALDEYVTGQVLSALAPAAMAVSLAAAQTAEAERESLDRLWRQRLERARLAADRARRQYQLAEPENRLVVRTLERDWEAALAEADRLNADYQRFTEATPTRLTAAELARIAVAADNLPKLWHAPTTTAADRKELLRTVIDSVTVAVVGSSELVDVTITWAGGHTTTGRATRPVARADQLSYYPRLVARVTELIRAGYSAAQIADALNHEGLRPAKRTNRFTPSQINTLAQRLDLHIRHPNSNPRSRSPHNLGNDLWSVRELAIELAMPTATVHNWIGRGWVHAHRADDGNYWIIQADQAELQRLRERRARPPGYYSRARWTAPRTLENGSKP